MKPKYAALEEFLMGQDSQEISMSFAEIEAVIAAKLPPSAYKHRPWWSNNPSNSVITNSWLRAGFKTERVDMKGRRLVFRRAAPGRSESDAGINRTFAERHARFRREEAMPKSQHAQPETAPAWPGNGGKEGWHPFFGVLKGTIRIAPGVDLTEPADPEWGKVYE